jgi:hypothetical protein
MRGGGEYASLLQKRFDIACRRFGFTRGRDQSGLDTTQFRSPVPDGGRQGRLF